MHIPILYKNLVRYVCIFLSQCENLLKDSPYLLETLYRIYDKMSRQIDKKTSIQTFPITLLFDIY